MVIDTKEGPIVVIGVTGTVGSRVAEKLAARNIPVRGVARDPSRFQGAPGVQLMKADCRELQEAERALQGARAVYLTPPEEGANPLKSELLLVRSVVEAAKRNNVEHLVVHTALQANQGDTGARLIDNKNEVEKIVKASGIPYTILRPGWFLQNLLATRSMIERGVLSLPLPTAHRFASVSAEDVAEAAIGFLEKGPQNRGFDLHIENGIKPDDLVGAIQRTAGRPVQYREAAVDDFLAMAALQENQKELQREFFGYIRENEFLGNPKEVTRILPEFRYTSPERFVHGELLVRSGMGSSAAASGSAIEAGGPPPTPPATPPEGGGPFPNPPGPQPPEPPRP